jgi:hypothetical protein
LASSGYRKKKHFTSTGAIPYLGNGKLQLATGPPWHFLVMLSFFLIYVEITLQVLTISKCLVTVLFENQSMAYSLASAHLE